MKSVVFPILISTSLLTGCMTTPAISDAERPQEWGQAIHSEHNLYRISPTVFRSEQPSAELIPYLKHNQIEVVINLRSRDQDSQVLANENFQLHHVPIHTWAIDREDLLEVMQLIQQAEQKQQKVLLHCYHGSDRTGASIAMYRIIFEHWPVEQALQEMKHGGYGFHKIWRNIGNLFSPENVKWIREQLTNPSTETSMNERN